MKQLNIQRADPLPDGAVLTDSVRAAHWPQSIHAEGWYALLPTQVSDQAMFTTQPLRRGPDGMRLRHEVIADRKYLPLVDLVPSGGDDVFASERLVRAFQDLELRGLEVELLPHASPHEVSGHRWYRVRCDGWLGDAPGTEMMRPPNSSVRGAPKLPLVIDPSQWNGRDVCWTPWFELGPRSAWRFLLVQGAVLSALSGRLPDLSYGAAPVTLKQPPPSVPRAGMPLRIPPAPPPSTVPLKVTLEAIAARRDTHVLGAPAADADLQHVRAKAPFALPEAYLELLRRWNGLRLYPPDWNPDEAALQVWSVGPDGVRDAEYADLIENSNAEHRPEWFGIAADVQGNVIWCVDEGGVVRGVGKEGIIYGPDAPFETWLGDMVRDLDWAADNPGAPGTDEFLARSGRM